MIQSSPNYTCKTRVLAWWHLPKNHDLKSQRPLVENRKWHVFILWWIAPRCFKLHSSKEVSQVIGPWSELWHFLNPCKHWGLAKDHPSPKDTMLSLLQCAVSYHRHTSVSWSETKPEQLYVSIFPHCHSATCWFTLKQEVLCKSTLHYPTGSKLLTHDHNPDLNSPIY